MTFKRKQYEDKIKMVQEQWLQLKMKFLLGYNMWENEPLVWGIKIW